MSKAAATSPFVHQDGEEPWITWSEQRTLLGLTERKQTEGRSVMENPQEEEPCDAPIVPPYSQPVVIQRPQYNAILNRMNQARQKTGAFTSWTT